MGPLKPSLASRGIQPQWSRWAVRITAQSRLRELGVAPSCALSIAFAPEQAILTTVAGSLGWPKRVSKGPSTPQSPPSIYAQLFSGLGHLQEEEARFHNKKKSSKHHPALPLYTLQEAEDSMGLFQPCLIWRDEKAQS